MTVEQETANNLEKDPHASFSDLGVAKEILDALLTMGFEHPTEVQEKSIPLMFEKKDLLVQSRTGTGKTVAFGVPIIQGLMGTTPRVQALILAPTRELALQVSAECGRIAASAGVRIMTIYGGAAMGPQVDALREGVHIVVGTPGRVLDHIRRGNLDTSSIHTLVLDEGDEMLSMGFLEEIGAIIDQLPTDRHTVLFSATIPDEIQRMADRYTKSPTRVMLSGDFVGVREIQHIYYLVTGGDRKGDLLRVLEFENPETAIIFCNTRDDTGDVADYLRAQGFKVEGISGDLTQRDREQVMGKMRQGDLRFLVATDIAARGIDLTDLSHVINYAFPESPDGYIHRTGRTGRAGKSGVAVSLVSPREIGSFYYLKLMHKIYPEERRLPSAEELATRREAAQLQELGARFEGRVALEEMRSLTRRVWSTLDGERMVALAFASVLGEKQDSATTAVVPSRHEDEAGGRGPDRPSGRDGEAGGRGSDRPSGRDGGPGGRGSDRPPRREGGPGRRPDRPPRGRVEHGTDRPPRDESRPRDESQRTKPDEPQPSSDAADRKRTRSHRPEQEDDQGVFTTPDGDVEYWETVDSPPAGEESVRLFINLGRQQGIRLPDLYQLVLTETGLVKDQLERVQLRSNFSFFCVPAGLADSVIQRLSGKRYKEREVRVERAKS